MKSNFIIYFTVILSTLLAIGCTQMEENKKSDSDQAEVSMDYASDASDVNPVLIGTKIPDTEVKTTDGETVRLRTLVKQQPTILIFYRGGWCPFCNRHLAEVQKIQQNLVETGYQILAISADRPEMLKESVEKHDLDYTLLSDSPMKAAKAFGLAFKVDQSTVERYKNSGIDLEKSSGYDHHLLPVPAVFVLDTDGMIHFQYVNPNYKTRIKSEVLLTAAEAYFPDNMESSTP